MADAQFQVQVEKDHLKKLASADAIKALSELIWNSVDADATRVEIQIDSDELAMHSVTVQDNGHGIPHGEIGELFGRLGGSWKRHGSRSKGKNRILHGKEGEGRLMALALGRSAEWAVRYRDATGKLLGYKVSLLRDDLVDVRVTEPKEVESALGTGVEVVVSELDKNYRPLDPASSVQSLSEIFAFYLADYRDVAIFVEADRLDPSQAIQEKVGFDLDPIVDGEGEDAKSYPVNLDLIEWKTATDRWFYLCGVHGFPFQRIQPRFHTPGYRFSAYLKSCFIDELQERGELDLADMIAPALAETQDAAVEVIKRHFEKKDAEAAHSEIEQWKEEEVYPYRVEPQTPVEEAERKVFDIVALNVNRHLPEFRVQSSKSRAFQMRMLRQAIERGPDELQHILTEVLELPANTQREMSKLLEEADLARWRTHNFVDFTFIFDTLQKNSRQENSMARSDMRDFEWDFIEKLLPNKSRGVKRVDDRRVINGILYALRTGIPWRDMPEQYGPWSTIYNRFNRWSKAGIWDMIFEAIVDSHNVDTVMVDSTSVRAHPTAAKLKKTDKRRCLGRSRGGLGTKIHASNNQDGLPLKLELTPNQANDAPPCETLLTGLQPGQWVLADKAYDVNWIRDMIWEQGAIDVIPSKSNRKIPKEFDKVMYRQRNKIERFFGRLKASFRRIATRYEHTSANFLAMIKLACVRLWLEFYEYAA